VSCGENIGLTIVVSRYDAVLVSWKGVSPSAAGRIIRILGVIPRVDTYLTRLCDGQHEN
jgi:hypothetical protein